MPIKRANAKPAGAGDADELQPTRRYLSGARILSVGIAATGLLTFAYFSVASHVLGASSAARIDVLWSVMFVVISVIYRPIEQLLSRTIAERRARGEHRDPLAVPLAIQAGFALAFLIVALALHEELLDHVFEGSEALYWVLVVGTLAYAASYFARGWLAGHERFGVYGGLVLIESFSRLCFALAVALGIASGQTAVALGIAVAPAISLVVVPAAFARAGRGARALVPGDGPHAPLTADEADAAFAGPATESVQEAAAHDSGLSLRRGGRFAAGVSAIMISEQTLLNAAVLTVALTAGDKALAGIVFNVMLIARAPLQLFQAVQTTLLPHLTGLEVTEGHEAFRRAVRLTVRWIAIFAAAVALALLAVGPLVMEHALFGQHYSYGRVGLALVGIGMGMHLTSGALNQAALARERTQAAAVLLARGRRPARGVDAHAGGLESAAARRARLPRRDERARAPAQRALPSGHRRAHTTCAGSGAAQRARDREIGLAGVRRTEDRRPRHEEVRARLPADGRGLGVDPAIDLHRVALAKLRAQPRHLAGRARDEPLPTPPRVDGHAERDVQHARRILERANGRRRVDGDPHAAAALVDEVGDVGDLRRRLEMERDRVRARIEELADLLLGTLDHQVRLDDRSGLLHLFAQGGHSQRADRDRRHEVAVHHVDVDHARAGGEDLGHLLAKPAEVGGEDRRHHLHLVQELARALHQIGFSIESPQQLHVSIAVEDIRTIVECSPQFGQTDASSKRCRQ